VTHTKHLLCAMVALASLLLCAGCDEDRASQASAIQKRHEEARKTLEAAKERTRQEQERTRQEQERRLAAEAMLQSTASIQWVWFIAVLILGAVAGTAIASKAKKDHKQN
jgi:hypothetical protein